MNWAALCHPKRGHHYSTARPDSSLDYNPLALEPSCSRPRNSHVTWRERAPVVCPNLASGRKISYMLEQKHFRLRIRLGSQYQ